MSYNKDTDYSELIDKSAKSGDYKSAAEYEAARNEKIDSENLSYKKTNDYSGWLDKTDYGNIIEEKISSGASKKSVADTLKKRVSKASGTKGLEQYAHDSIYDSAIKYIMEGKSFEYDDDIPKYRDKYSGMINNAMRKIENADDFSYDPLSDELYALYREEYRKAGSRAMEDTLGKIASNTGGVASSYALSAAGQAYDYFNSQTAEKIPELYKLAYGQYIDSMQGKYDRLNTLIELGNDDYSRYRDEVSDYENDRKQSYDSFLSALDYDYKKEAYERENYENDRNYERSNYEDERDYERDVLENDRIYNRAAYESDRDYERSVYEDNRNYDHEMKLLEQEALENQQKLQQQEYQDRIDNAIKKWGELGYLDAESAEILGLPAGTQTSDYMYKKAQTKKLLSK